jgi:hypothetical protein
LRIDRRDYAASMNARRSAACDDGST